MLSVRPAPQRLRSVAIGRGLLIWRGVSRGRQTESPVEPAGAVPVYPGARTPPLAELQWAHDPDALHSLEFPDELYDSRLSGAWSLTSMRCAAG